MSSWLTGGGWRAKHKTTKRTTLRTETMTLMTAKITDLTDFERGQRDFLGGRQYCPFTVKARVEAWRDGWLTEAA